MELFLGVSIDKIDSTHYFQIYYNYELFTHIFPPLNDLWRG